MLAGWVNEQNRAVHAYLMEENRVLGELHGRKRLGFSDDQRRRLAAKGHALGRQVLREVEPVVTPDTILRWDRALTGAVAPHALVEVHQGALGSDSSSMTVTRSTHEASTKSSATRVWPM